jgi:tetratricopeptide (TPR) repeat protein
MSAGRGAYGLALGVSCALLCLAMASAVLPALARDKTDDAYVTAAFGSRGELREGGKQAHEASRLNPFAVEPLFAEAAIASRQGRYDRAADLLTDATHRQPDNAEVWFQLGRLQILFNNAAGAYSAALKGLALDRGDLSLYNIVGFGSVDERGSASATGTPLPEPMPPQPPPG